VYYWRTRFCNKTLTFTSFCCKIIGIYVIQHWYAISASKIIIVVFVLETNIGDVGGFLQVQHYWGVNSCYDLLNPGLWKLWTIHWSRHVPTTKSTPFVVSEDEWDTKEGPGKSMKNVLHYGVPKGTSRDKATSNSKKIKPKAIIKLRLSEGIRQLVS